VSEAFEVWRRPGAVLYRGDCLDVLPTLAEGSVDAVVTDPPAGISFMGAEWDRFGRGRDAFIAFLSAAMRECLRVLKPGGYALVWALPRTSHWTATAVEDAGFEVRDRIAHLFGQGFPKGRACLKPACEDWWLCRRPAPRMTPLNVDECRIAGSWSTWRRADGSINHDLGGSSPAPTDRANGRGRRTEPEEHPAGRWPPNVALSHVGGPDGCRLVGTKRVKGHAGYPNGPGGSSCQFSQKGEKTTRTEAWPGHADADGLETVEAWECVESCPVRLLDEQAGERKSGGKAGAVYRRPEDGNVYRKGMTWGNAPSLSDSGGPSRFFATFPGEPCRVRYCPKASRKDRGEGNDHPTCKSTALMSWLVSLVTKPGDVVLDPFAGSGSTGVACLRAGREFVGVERDAHYWGIARDRLAGADGPLFAHAAGGGACES
jgi:hypothetical protein